MMTLLHVAKLMSDDIIDRVYRCFNEPQIEQQAIFGGHRTPALSELSYD